MPEGVVLVTGVSGYIGSHVLKHLLEEGYKVRGTVRSLENSAKVTFLKGLVPEAEERLELVEANLTEDKGWNEAVDGCSSVIHVASPFPNVTFNPNLSEDEIVGPAKEGTLRVLKAAVEKKIKKVVLTSSCVATDTDTTNPEEKTYSEEAWTNIEGQADAYTKSKVLAEKAAWDYLKELPDEDKFELIVINPTLVLGPALNESHKDSTSVQVIAKIMNRAFPAWPKLSFGCCDVRDVAKAHVKALSTADAHGKRHLIYSETLFMKEMAAILAKEFRPQGYSISTLQAPYFCMWMYGLFNKGMRSLLPKIGKKITSENQRMKDVLGIEPTQIETTLKDMAYSLIELGIVKKAKNYKQGQNTNEEEKENKEEETKEEKTEETKSEKIEKELEPEDKEEKKDEPKKEEIKEVAQSEVEVKN